MIINPDALYQYLLSDLEDGCAGIRDILSGSSDDYFPDASTRQVACLRLGRAFYKKFADRIKPDADERCLDKFLASNNRCAEWKPLFVSSRDEEFYGEVKSVIDDFLHPGGEPLIQSYFDILQSGRCGPGASRQANGNDFYTKLFSSPLTTTNPELYKLYNEFVAWYPVWSDGEICRAMHFGTYREIDGSSLSFVRKTRDISRSICTEPSLNMFYQLGIGAILEKRLAQFFGIDLASQPEMNRYLAYIGSTRGGLSTIDLESASDSLSLRLALDIFPSWFCDLLVLTRSPATYLGDTKIPLHMLSSMGNGYTFPLQTLVFAAVVVAASRFQGLNLGPAGKFTSPWGVFGDDIAMPSSLDSMVRRGLDLLGFRVNATKSYSEGPFRESCGHDYYLGSNVRGVYCRSLETPQDRYVLINLLNDWSARCGVQLHRTVGYLCDSVRYLAIPYFEAETAGIRTPYAPVGYWHSKQHYLYRCYTAVPVRLYVSGEGSRTFRYPPGKRWKRRLANLPGLLMSFVGGYVDNMAISLSLKQGEKPSYRTVTRVAPYWGPSLQQVQQAADPDFWERWKTAASGNLNDQTS